MDDGHSEGGKREGKMDTPIFETWLPLGLSQTDVTRVSTRKEDTNYN